MATETVLEPSKAIGSSTFSSAALSWANTSTPDRSNCLAVNSWLVVILLVTTPNLEPGLDPLKRGIRLLKFLLPVTESERLRFALVISSLSS